MKNSFIINAYFQGTPHFSANKTHSHDITEMLLKVALSTINLNTNLRLSQNDYVITTTNVYSSLFSFSVILEIENQRHRNVIYKH